MFDNKSELPSIFGDALMSGQREIPRDHQYDRRPHFKSAMGGFVTVIVIGLNGSDVIGIFCLHGFTYLVRNLLGWRTLRFEKDNLLSLADRLLNALLNVA